MFANVRLPVGGRRLPFYSIARKRMRNLDCKDLFAKVCLQQRWLVVEAAAGGSVCLGGSKQRERLREATVEASALVGTARCQSTASAHGGGGDSGRVAAGRQQPKGQKQQIR